MRESGLRILFVTCYYKPAYVYGGPVRSIASACEGLAEAGAQVSVFTTNANGSTRLAVPLQQAVDVDGVGVQYFPLALKGLSCFYSRSLTAALNARVPDFDLVFIATLWGHALLPAAAACLRFKVPYIVSIHGQLFPWALAQRRLKKRLHLRLLGRHLLDRAAAIRCTDPVEAQAVANHGFRSPTFVVPNAIPVDTFCTSKPAGLWRQQMGIPDGAHTVLFLGRLTSIKRPDIAVDALAAAQFPDRETHLLMAGPDQDGLRPGLEAQAQALGCANRLHFTGLLEKDDVISVLQDADLLLMPSEVQENFGMSALEAMAAGVPILVSEGVPVGWWAQRSGSGRVVACTRRAFQQATHELLSQPDELRKMGERGKVLVRQRFDVPVVARQTLAQCAAIVATGRPLIETESGPEPHSTLESAEQVGRATSALLDEAVVPVNARQYGRPPHGSARTCDGRR